NAHSRSRAPMGPPVRIDIGRCSSVTVGIVGHASFRYFARKLNPASGPRSTREGRFLPMLIATLAGRGSLRSPISRWTFVIAPIPAYSAASASARRRAVSDCIHCDIHDLLEPELVREG